MQGTLVTTRCEFKMQNVEYPLYFIVDKRIFLLSMTFMERCPYKYNSDWLLKWLRLFLRKISITLTAKVTLWGKKDKKRKWMTSSTPQLQWQISEWVSRKLWWLLWLLRGLKFTLSWKGYRSPNGSCTPKIHFGVGRIRDKICPLGRLKDGVLWKCLMILFQGIIPSGKKLFICLKELHLISWKVLKLVRLYRGLEIGGSLSLSHVIQNLMHL